MDGGVMDIIQEYLRQQSWRNWQRYIRHLPTSTSDHVLDLGCSVGAVSNLLSQQVARVTGIDANPDFIAYCNTKKNQNQHFICSDFLKVNYTVLQPITG